MARWKVQRFDTVTDTTGVTCTVAVPFGLLPPFEAGVVDVRLNLPHFDFSRRNL